MQRDINDVYHFESNIGTEKDPVIIKHKFDYALYMRYIIKIKSTFTDKIIKDHPAIGQYFIYNNNLCVIETVSRHWHFGYYEYVVYRKHGTLSHGTIMMKNISSLCSIIIESGEEYLKCKKINKEEVYHDKFS